MPQQAQLINQIVRNSVPSPKTALVVYYAGNDDSILIDDSPPLAVSVNAAPIVQILPLSLLQQLANAIVFIQIDAVVAPKTALMLTLFCDATEWSQVRLVSYTAAFFDCCLMTYAHLLSDSRGNSISDQKPRGGIP